MGWLIAAAVVISGLWGIGWCFCKIAALADEDEETESTAYETYSWAWEPDDR